MTNTPASVHKVVQSSIFHVLPDSSHGVKADMKSSDRKEHIPKLKADHTSFLSKFFPDFQVAYCLLLWTTVKV